MPAIGPAPRWWFWSHGYPLDLDAVGHGLSVRFALIAAA
jgi:hypothetical protein